MNKSGRWAMVLTLGVLFCITTPLYAAQTTVPVDGDLSAAVTAATSGDVLVLEGNPAPVTSTIVIDKTITIQGYDANICEVLPTERIISGPGDNCFTETDTNLFNADFELGPVNWQYTPPANPIPDTDVPAYVPPALTDIITGNGAPYEGAFHALFDLESKGAEAKLRYLDLIPTLPGTLNEEVRWATDTGTLCNVMDLTTETSYTLPVLPPMIVETFSASPYPVGAASGFMHIWLQVLQHSGHPDDKIEVYVDGTLMATASQTALQAWRTAATWQRWTFNLVPVPVTNVEVLIRVTTRTDVPVPTTVLMGALYINNDAAMAAPTTPDSINLLDYSSNLGEGSMLPAGILNVLSSPMNVGAGPAQIFLARAGGMGTPSLSANLRLAAPPASGSVQMIYGSHAFPPVSLADLNAVCSRVEYTIPPSMFNVPGRPRVRVSGASSGLVVDDLVLSYIAPVLVSVYPDLANGVNLIPNGGFESGTYPFLIESPATDPVNCPHISEVIQNVEFCNGSRAAVFKPTSTLVVWLRMPQSSGLSTDAIRVMVMDDGGAETELFPFPLEVLLEEQRFNANLTPEWKAYSIPFSPPSPMFTVILRSAIQTNTPTPSMFLLGGIDIQSSPVPPEALPSPSAIDLATDLTVEPTVLAPSTVDPLVLPPMLIDAPLLAVPGHTHVVRFGGLGTTVKFDLKLVSPIPAPGPGNATMTVPIPGGTDWVISDSALTDVCALQVVTPDHFPPATNFELSFVSSILPNAEPIDPTEFFLDNVCVSYLALANTPEMDNVAAALGLAVPCDRNQILEGDFEVDPPMMWEVTPIEVPITDVIMDMPACDASEPNKAAIFKGNDAPAPVWELVLWQDNITLPTVATELLLTFQLNTVRIGAQPGEFLVQIDGVDQFVRRSDAGGEGVYNEYTVDISTYQGTTVEIRFIARLPRSISPAAFALDDIQICEAGNTGPLFRVLAGGQLTLRSVMLEDSERGVDVEPGGVLNFLQAKARDLGGSAITDNGGRSLIASAVLHANRGHAINVTNATSRVMVLQSTIRDNTGAGVYVADGMAHVAASLLDGNARGIQRVGGTAVSYVNWVQGNDHTDAVTPAGFANLDVADGAPSYRDVPWRGKLNTPLLPSPDEPILDLVITRMRTAMPTFPKITAWYRDFECDQRDPLQKAQIGADELDLTPVLCAPDSLGAEQQPHLPGDVGVGEFYSNNADYVVEYTPADIYGSVRRMTWWGVWKNGVGDPCAAPSVTTEFKIATYSAPGAPEIDTITITPYPTVLTGYVYGGATLYKYDYFFERDELFRDQYLSIRALVNVADDCYFHWVTSPVGTAAAVEEDGTPINTNLSLCISEFTIADECALGSFITQPPMHPSTPGPPVIKSTESSPVYERVAGGTGIGVIEFWGIWLDETGQSACTPPADVTFVVKYVDSTNLGTVADDGVITVDGRLLSPAPGDLGDEFTAPDGSLAPWYRYAFAPTGGINITNGYLSIHQLDTGTTCRFHWIESAFGGNQAITWTGPGDEPVDLGRSVSLCLGSAPTVTVTGCSISPPILGKDQVGTYTLIGENLIMIDTVLLLPQMPLPGMVSDENNPTLYVDLMNSPVFQGYSYSERMGTSMEIRFRMLQPFNASADGTVICTDGRARFVPVINSVPDASGPGVCDMLIDTIAPVVMVIENSPLYDAGSGGPPRIQANRVVPSLSFPNWYPGDGVTNTPKNDASFLTDDMQVYLNAGSRFDIPFDLAGDLVAEGPFDVLRVTVEAQFRDSLPNDGTPYNVEIAGFIDPAFTASPHSPYVYPDPPNDLGTARWNGLPTSWINGEAIFAPDAIVPDEGQYMTVWWNNVEFFYNIEPWRTRFSLEARDLAGNVTETDQNGNPPNAINLHWLFRTRAKFQTEIDMAVENPEIYWRLDRSFADLPGAKPGCTPLAMFRLYWNNGGVLNLVGESPWRAEPLRGSSVMSGSTLQRLLEQYQGNWMCLAVWGADETGNVQFDNLGGYAIPDDFIASNVDFICWMNGERRTPNLAVDTSIRVELYHERYNASGRYRNYGTATRVPLPPLAEACDTRVNGDVTMKALLPTADQRIVDITSGVLLWKLYKEGALVARGTAPMIPDGSVPAWYVYEPNADGTIQFGTVRFNIMNLLVNCEEVALVNDLGDQNADSTFKVHYGQSLPLTDFLALPPNNTVPFPYPVPPYTAEEVVDCPSFGDFDFRLGDEGRRYPLASPNYPSYRRREIRYTLTAQSVAVYQVFTEGDMIEEMVIDATPATSSFSIYVRDVEEQVRDEAPVREFGR